MNKTTKNILKYVIGFGLGGGLMYMAISSIGLEKTKEAFQKADYSWVFISMMIAILSHWFRAARWKQLLDAAGYKSNTPRLFAAIMVGYLVNAAVPRAGEVARGTLGAKTERVPVSTSFGTIITDRILDFIVLGSMVLVIFALEIDQINTIYEHATTKAGLSQESSSSLKWFILGGGALVGVLVLAFRKKLMKTTIGEKLGDFLGQMWDAIKSIRKMKNPGMFIFYSLGIWVCYVFMTYLCFFAFPETENIGIYFGLIAFVLGGIGMVIPSPGGIGSYHFAVSLAFWAYASMIAPDVEAVTGVPLTQEGSQELGYQLALLIHTAQLVMMIIMGGLGFLFLMLTGLKNADLPPQGEEESAAKLTEDPPVQA